MTTITIFWGVKNFPRTCIEFSEFSMFREILDYWLGLWPPWTGWLWSDAKNNRTTFAEALNEWKQIEHNMCDRRAAKSSMWRGPCYIIILTTPLRRKQVIASIIYDSRCGISDVAFCIAPPIGGPSCSITFYCNTRSPPPGGTRRNARHLIRNLCISGRAV